MIVAIERNKFTYLYKYNEIRVDINQLIDFPIEKLKSFIQKDRVKLIEVFNKALPVFEQDHEVILLDIDKNKIVINGEILLKFGAINCIYPLTTIGKQLIEGKISNDFNMESPIFESAIEALKLKRSIYFRRNTSETLLNIFNLENVLTEEEYSLIENSAERNVLDKTKPQKFTNYFDYLIAYNKTPSFIPDGDIEYICKIGIIAIKYLGKSEDIFTNGPFYKSIVKYKNHIRNLTFYNSYNDFCSIKDNDLKSSHEKILELISGNSKNVDVFKTSYFYLAFKGFLNKNENRIDLLTNDIIQLIENDKKTASYVLALLGYTFSIENLYEGIHKLANASLLKSKQLISSKVRNKGSKDIFAADEYKFDEKLEPNKLAKEFSSEKLEISDNIPSTSEDKQKSSESIVDVQLTEKIIENKEPQSESANLEYSDTIDLPAVEFEKIDSIDEPEYSIVKSENVSDDDKYELNDSERKSTENSNNILDNVVEDAKLSFENDIVTLTVKSFRSYIEKEQTKSKLKLWSEFLEHHFPYNNEEISKDSLLDKLDKIPELKDKLLRSKKDKEQIRDFFSLSRK